MTEMDKRVARLVEENKDVLDRLARGPTGPVKGLHYRIDVDLDTIVEQSEHEVRNNFRRASLAHEQELISCWKRAKDGKLEGYNKP
jgi:hypothetical protein